MTSNAKSMNKRLFTSFPFYRYASILIKGIGLLALVIIFTMPFLWMIASAFKPRAELFTNVYPFSWRAFVPLHPTLDNFKTLFQQYNFAIPVINSIGLAIAAVVISLTLSSMIAYVLAWLEFPGRELLFTIILSTMLIAFEAKLVPLFLILQRLHLYNTYFGILVPWLTDAYFIFLLRQHFKEIPQEMFEAAILDGCSYFRVYWNVMLPNITPGLISAAFIKFMFTWDSFVWPLIAVRDESKMVITVAIAKLFSNEYSLWELVFAGSFVATIPVIILFFFLQRYYVQGYMTSGLKG
jgi:multiple sugar transport system permease protein